MAWQQFPAGRSWPSRPLAFVSVQSPDRLAPVLPLGVELIFPIGLHHYPTRRAGDLPASVSDNVASLKGGPQCLPTARSLRGAPTMFTRSATHDATPRKDHLPRTPAKHRSCLRANNARTQREPCSAGHFRTRNLPGSALSGRRAKSSHQALFRRSHASVARPRSAGGR